MNFTSVLTPSPCLEENIFELGENVFLSVCSVSDNINNRSMVIIDKRKFTGTVKSGLKLSIVGINLNLHQWTVLKDSTTIIDDIAIDLFTE